MSDILVFKEVNGCFILEEDMSMKDKIFSKAKDIKDDVVCLVSNKRNLRMGLVSAYVLFKVYRSITRKYN